MALGYLYSLMGRHVSLEGLSLQGRIDEEEVAVIRHQVESGLNAPQTSGAGRLFDAVSAIAGVRLVADYDAQAAIELEVKAMEAAASEDRYAFDIAEEAGCRVVKLAELFGAIVRDVKLGVTPSVVAARFHRTLADMIVGMCRLISADYGLRLVALSGGVFQNRLLTRMTVSELRRQGFEVMVQRVVPCNDGGISLGQAVIAHSVAE